MAADSVGQIGLDLTVNQNQFNRQMGGIQKTAAKAGKVLAAAFAVKQIVDFGKECINLGSDLTEVQNVVDVTFPKMQAQVNDFAQSAAQSFGLSKTMAKKFTGTFGAMAKAFGFSESEAYNMSTTLTGLAGDVASFYNITQDEAFTKLKSVFSGETETLKDLGIVMTQTALDQYALANGFGKTTSAMTEQEKVALRYAFVQQQLALAQGDFTRTSGSWANQVRVLKLQFEGLKATIGQGLINLFTPLLKGINLVISKIAKLASAFKGLTELFTGKKSTDGSASMGETATAADTASDSMQDASSAASNTADGVKDIGTAAKKTRKQLSSLGFDELNTLNSPDDSSGSSGSSGDSGGGGAAIDTSAMDFGKAAPQNETILSKWASLIDAVVKKAKELKSLFLQGFKIGLGDSLDNLKVIKKNIESIGKSLIDIWTDKRVLAAANRWLNAVALNLGKIAGSLASVGITIATNITGGIARYLDQNKEYIKQRIIGLFDVSTKVWNLMGDLCTAIADIFSVFASSTGQQITANIIGIFSNATLGGTQLIMQFAADIIDLIVSPIVSNAGKIKTALTNTLKPIQTFTGAIKNLVTDTFQKVFDVYNKYVAPAFKNFKDGIDTIFGGFLDAYNKYFAPTLSYISKKFGELTKKYIQPLINKFLELAGKVVYAISVIWEKISPFVSFFVNTVVKQLSAGIKAIWDIFEPIAKGLVTSLGGILTILGGIVDFVTGVLTGDWKKAWSGIKSVFSGALNVMKGVAQTVIGAIKGIFTGLWTAIKSIFTPVAGFFKTVFTSAFNFIKSAFSTASSWAKGVWGFITTPFTSVGTWFKTKFTGAFTAIKNAFSSAKSWASGVWTSIKNGLGDIKEKFNNLFSKGFSGMKNAFSGVASWASKLWTTIKSKFTNLGTKIGNAIGGAVKTAINGVLRTIENIINSAIRMINGAIGVINKIPGVSLGKISSVALPRLAQGGFVEKNTPQIAMIGDNRHQGEVVAPEDKLREMAAEAARMVAGSGGISKSDLEGVITVQIDRLIAALSALGFYVDSEELAKAVRRGDKKLDRRMNPVVKFT